MKKTLFFLQIFLLISCGRSGSTISNIPAKITLNKDILLDKVKGGWAGQIIGCTYGGPTEFEYRGGMIPEYTPIPWPDGYIKKWYDNSSWLYDDVYMDLTFVEVFERLGMDAPVDSFAMAFATAPYSLWHANQAARSNILNGIMPPKSGHWLYNPHADDIDYQIEADFAGLMCPGMPNSASAVSDKIGHIMCYGDGWYGGVYVAAMYSLAFVTDDVEIVVKDALKTIPQESRFYKCISDVISWHKQYPNDWQQTWFECARKWNEDIGCPEGVFNMYNIDAVINSAYVVIGLLYGEKDFYKTMDISTRCGQDSDCNPATAAGILGTMVGYSQIPEYWMKNLREVEDIALPYTSLSLNKVYNVGFKHAQEMIRREGGTVNEDCVIIKYQEPVAVNYEQSFEGHYPIESRRIRKPLTEVEPIEFEGTGIVLRGVLTCNDPKYIAEVEVYIDGDLIEINKMPALYHDRREEVCYIYQLQKGKHTLTCKWINPRSDAAIKTNNVLIYSDSPQKELHSHIQ